MLNLWLGSGASRIPPFATHKIGVAGLVRNSRGDVLVVRERHAPDGSGDAAAAAWRGWKLPGGLADLGEELGETARREVEEETGVRCTFGQLLALRHQHNTVFGRSDLYFVCEMGLDEGMGGSEIAFDASEIAECRWMPAEEYATAAEGQMNKLVAGLLQGATPGGIGLQEQALQRVPGRSKGGMLYLPTAAAGPAATATPAPAPAAALAASCAKALLRRGETVATAEGSAGGLLASELLGVAGASRFFADGIVCYSKASKERWLALGVEQQAAARSATEAHALMLAHAVREQCNSAWGVAETGVAGPGPSGRGVAPGTCCVAVVGPGGLACSATVAQGGRGSGNGSGSDQKRTDNMRNFAQAALQLLGSALAE
eukprot:g5814.t1